MDLGFINAGFKITYANDIDSDSVKTYKKNISKDICLGDIKNINPKNLPTSPDVIIGGFPCQGFSIANKQRSTEDKRNFLYQEMLRLINAKKPKFFVAENVKGIMNLSGGKILQMILRDFRKIGYYVDFKLLNAVNYGVPQYRERVFLIGNRLGLENPFPNKTHVDKNIDESQSDAPLFNGSDVKLMSSLSTENAIGHLSNIKMSNKPVKAGNKIIYNHMRATNVHDEFYARKYHVKQEDICDYLKKWRKKAKISTKKIDEIFGYKHTAGHWFRKDNNSGSIPNPDDWKNLKKILKFDNKFDKQVTTLELKDIAFEQSLRITNWKRPSDTITATGPEIHVNKKRRLTVRECAILQTFPDNFIFEGSTFRSMHQQVGNAVPPILAEKIAKEIKKILRNN